MSFAGACRATNHTHVVIARHGNSSAFNGYHWTPSDYSHVLCLDTKLHWRTKAQYVETLPDINPEQERKWLHG